MADGNYDAVVENGSSYSQKIGYIKLASSNRQKKFWYNEEKLVAELKDYIEETYGEYYVSTGFQMLDGIFASGNGPGFCMGNIQKLAFRYGKKHGYNRLDLLKILHYGILMLYCHDRDIRDATAGEKSDGTSSN